MAREVDEHGVARLGDARQPSGDQFLEVRPGRLLVSDQFRPRGVEPAAAEDPLVEHLGRLPQLFMSLGELGIQVTTDPDEESGPHRWAVRWTLRQGSRANRYAVLGPGPARLTQPPAHLLQQRGGNRRGTSPALRDQGIELVKR